jgi:nicotinate-nucleotide pyrophosphorylase (carboxylating)
MTLDPLWLDNIITVALNEDLGGPTGVDVTTQATIPAAQCATAQVIARAPGVVAAVEIFARVWAHLSERLGCGPVIISQQVSDGSEVATGDLVLTAAGPTAVLLIGERTALNLVCRASGIATATRQWAEELAETPALVLDTRKTTPGLRHLEKYAVRCGGGTNKRMGLYDVAMIKDNHIRAAGSITAAFAAVQAKFPQLPVQVEVSSTAQALEAVAVGAQFLLCDNMPIPLLTATVAAIRDRPGPRVELEATGGLTLDVARSYGETGVDFLSVGALTHSSPILDLALDLCEGNNTGQ